MDRSILYHFSLNTENAVGSMLTSSKSVDVNKINDLMKFHNKPLEIEEEIEDMTLQEEIYQQHEDTLRERETRENDRRDANERKNMARLEIQEKVETEKKKEADEMDQQYAEKLSAEENARLEEQERAKQEIQRKDEQAFQLMSEFSHLEYETSYKLLEEKNWNFNQVAADLRATQE